MTRIPVRGSITVSGMTSHPTARATGEARVSGGESLKPPLPWEAPSGPNAGETWLQFRDRIAALVFHRRLLSAAG